jgi:hypothetical protein
MLTPMHKSAINLLLRLPASLIMESPVSMPQACLFCLAGAHAANIQIDRSCNNNQASRLGSYFSYILPKLPLNVLEAIINLRTIPPYRHHIIVKNKYPPLQCSQCSTLTSATIQNTNKVSDSHGDLFSGVHTSSNVVFPSDHLLQLQHVDRIIASVCSTCASAHMEDITRSNYCPV